MPVAIFRILGPLECQVGDTLIRINGAKQQSVLGMLLVAEAKPVELSRLIEAVWDGAVPSTAAKQIRNAVSDLRRVLAGAGVTIRRAGDGYQLDRAGARFDLEDFTRQVALAGSEPDPARRARALRSALSLWRGRPLPGLTGAALRSRMVSAEELRLTALEQCIELELKLGEHGSLIGELTTAVSENPFRERFVAQLMIALCRSGARAQALRVFDTTRRRLRDELGVDPDPELRRLHLRMVSNVAPAAGEAPARPGPALPWYNLPGVAVRLTGRDREEATVLQALQRPADAPAPPAVVAIDGMAGVGKTAFALHLGRRLAAAYPDGQLFIGLGAHGVTGRWTGVSAALSVLLRACGVPAEAIPADLEERRAAWRNRLLGRRVLVILDDAVSTAHVIPLLAGVPGCLTVVTSRRRLASLHSTCQLSLAEFSIAAGRDLFNSVVGDDRPLADAAAVDEILRQCGRLPLAIRSAAVRLRHRAGWSVSYLAARLADHQSRLAELSMENTEVAAAFDTSFQGLDAEHRRLFQLLGRVDAQDFDLESVAALAGRPAAQVAGLLEELVDCHLLKATGPGRYSMNELVRAYSMTCD